MVIQDLNQALRILQKYIPVASNYSGDSLSLDRMWPLLKIVGNPHQKLKAIHVAGTSGKTSTCYYLSHILTKSGKKTGLTVSPHVDSITERLQINGKPVSEEVFCKLLGDFMDLAEPGDQKLSYFEIMIVFVLWAFVELKVEYAVIETGMGGLLDGTNVVTRPDKICVITDIGLDHTHVLGNTIAKIALQKVGIIHSKNQVFYYNQGVEITNILEDYASLKNGIVNQVNYVENPGIHLPIFQKRNYLLAMTACEFLARRDNFELLYTNPKMVVIPARMEKFSFHDGSLLIVDGAHNQQKMKAFVASVQQEYLNQTALIVLALKVGKEYRDVIDELEPIIDTLIITTFATSQDLPARSQDPKIIEEYALSKGLKCKIIENSEDTFDYLLNSSSKLNIITGSFYLIGQIRRLPAYKNSVIL